MAKGETYPQFKARVDRRLDAVESRLDQHDEELDELDQDVLAIAEVCARGMRRRAKRLRMLRIRRRRKRS